MQVCMHAYMRVYMNIC